MFYLGQTFLSNTSHHKQMFDIEQRHVVHRNTKLDEKDPGPNSTVKRATENVQLVLQHGWRAMLRVCHPHSNLSWHK